MILCVADCGCYVCVVSVGCVLFVVYWLRAALGLICIVCYELAAIECSKCVV